MRPIEREAEREDASPLIALAGHAAIAAVGAADIPSLSELARNRRARRSPDRRGDGQGGRE